MTVARSGILYLAGNLLSAGVPFLLLPLLTRVLAPADYGVVINFFVLLAFCTPFAGLNVHGALGVAWFQKTPQELPTFVGNAIGVAIASTLILAVVVYFLVRLLMPSELGFAPGWAAVAAITAGGQVLLQCRLVLWQSQGRPIPNIALQFVNSALNASLSLAGVLLLGWGGEGRIAGAATATLVVASVAVLLLRTASLARWKPRTQDARELFRFGGLLVPHTFAGVLLTNADRFVVSTLLGTAALGTYGAAAQLGSIMAITADAFVKAFNPWLFGRLQSGEPGQSLLAVGAMYAAVPGFLVLGVLMWIGLYLGGALLLGPQYRSALGLLPWFMLGGAFSGIYASVAGLYFFRARTALLSSISFPIAIAGLCCTAVLVHFTGTSGAAMGYALIQGLLALGSWAVARRNFDLPWDRPLPALRALWQAAFPLAVQR